MNSDQLAQSINDFMPALGGYRSVRIPTLRFSRPMYLIIWAPQNSPDHQSNSKNSVPPKWLFVDAASERIAACASSDMIQLIPDSDIENVSVDTSRMHPKEAHEILGAELVGMSQQFLAGELANPAGASAFQQALLSSIPIEYCAWVQVCCADFFEWLAP